MSSKMNPYGVGYSGEDHVEQRGVCGCCGLKFRYTVVRTQPTRRSRCGPCESHYEMDSEPTSRTIERRSDHEERYRQWAVAASKKATE